MADELVLIKLSELTQDQIARITLERLMQIGDKMSEMHEEIQHLQASVDTELAEALKQTGIIDELKQALADARAAEEAAVAGEAKAKSDLDVALAAAEAAADKLDSNDPPAEPEPEPEPETPVEGEGGGETPPVEGEVEQPAPEADYIYDPATGQYIPRPTA